MAEAKTTITVEEAYDTIMDWSMPIEELKALRDKITRRIHSLAKPITHRKTKRERFMECVGAWADDPRTTAEIIADIRKDLNFNFERYENVFDNEG